VADDGGARPESVRERCCQWLEAAVRVRGAVGRLGRSRGAVGEEWGREDEWARSRLSGAVIGATERERKERGSDRGNATRHGTASWCLAPTGGQRPDRVPARRCSDNGALAPIGQAPVAARAGRRRWRAGARGPAREESGVAEAR
jgi:hypothetical protein